jgi:NADH dehydrogenase [ubiquinone] 1 alpha subcomplex assembly factor 1
LLRTFFIGVGCVCLSLVWVLSLASDKSTGKEKMKRLANTNELVLFDFNSDVSVLAWRAVNDTVMGGVSSSRMEQSIDGKAVFTGNVSLENNGGFASVRGPQIQKPLGEFEGIAVRIRGDGKRYNCGLRTDDLFESAIHQASFDTKVAEWQLLKIPFTDFIPTYHGRRLSEDRRMKREDIKSVSF